MARGTYRVFYIYLAFCSRGFGITSDQAWLWQLKLTSEKITVILIELPEEL